MQHARTHVLRRPLVATLLGLALVAAACGGGETTDDPSSTTSPTEADTGSEAPSGPQTVTVFVDADIEGSNVAVLNYLPTELTVRQGDTVEFALQPGDPHTVTFGALVDAAFEAMAGIGEGDPPPPEVMAIPQAFDEQFNVINAGVLPCFSDEPPTDGPPCEQTEQPDFAGTLGFYNSGVMGEPGATFTVPIAADATPGTYNYFCLIHGPDMSGTMTVVEATADAPTAAEVAEDVDATIQAITEEAASALEATSQGTQPGFEDAYPEGGDVQVLAGGGAQPQGFTLDILTFGPADVEVAAGGTVRFNMFGFHTVSFNATQDATPLVIQGDDGLPAINQLAIAPQGGANGAPPPPEGEGEPPAEAIVIDGGTFDGSGFFSSGVLPSFPPVLMAYDITFSTAGTYAYQCLIHPGMEGTVNVTG